MFSAPCWCACTAGATLRSAAIFPAARPTGQRLLRRRLPAPRSGPRARRRAASAAARPAPSCVRAARRGATRRSRSPQTTSVGTRTRAATAHSDSPRHQLRTIAFAVRSNASGPQGWRLRASSSATASASRCSGATEGSPKHSRTTLSMRSRLVIALSPSRARRPAGPGSAARSSRGSDTRRGSGLRSGMAGETSVSERTSSGRRAATRIAIAPPRELPSRCTGRPRPARKRTQRVGVAFGGVVGCGGRAGEPEAGQVDGQARRPRREQAREVGPVGARAGESVHVDGLDVGRAGRLAHVQGDAARGDLAAGPGTGVGVEASAGWPGRRPGRGALSVADVTRALRASERRVTAVRPLPEHDRPGPVAATAEPEIPPCGMKRKQGTTPGRARRWTWWGRR